MSLKQIVTIDGPSGVGKSTISRKVAAALGFTYLDTGAMYRAVGLALSRSGVDYGNDSKVELILDQLMIELLSAKGKDEEVGVLLNGEDISEVIRTPEASMLASRASSLLPVRSHLTRLQQQIGAAERIVAEGRDTGTVVFPEAAYKFYLDAEPHERARRRIAQLKASGSDVDQDTVLALIIKRDQQDTERTIAPLKKAEDARCIDTTRLTIDQVVSAILKEIPLPIR